MIIKKLQSIPMLSNINSDVLNKHLKDRNIYIQSYSKGETVHNKKDSCYTLDIVIGGSLIAYSLLGNGSATTMFEFKTHSILGASLLFGENNSYPFNIYCLVDCKLLHVTRKALSEFLHDYNFVINYIKSLSQNSQGINQKIEMFTQKTLRENILDYLKQQSVIQKSSNIVLPLSKKELADYLGVQRPSLFRELKKLKDENIIDIDNRTISIKINNKFVYYH
ncbi:Crp/Fnr family transcriptional regulator [Clostridium sp.]|uniref:Crp/Fnr family transcriptional regulator n=1 Tax=Clostridium sp. TaxID=1506 RepID=UPI00261C3F21|nr:Crp/Fnr family transcriptional regulator [Clostridium sp.]